MISNEDIWQQIFKLKTDIELIRTKIKKARKLNNDDSEGFYREKIKNIREQIKGMKWVINKNKI